MTAIEYVRSYLINISTHPFEHSSEQGIHLFNLDLPNFILGVFHHHIHLP